MKLTTLILITLSTLNSIFGQTQKQHIKYEPNEYVVFVNKLIQDSKSWVNIKWIYYKPALSDTTLTDYFSIPSVEILIDNDFDSLEFNSSDFNSVSVKVIRDFNIIDYDFSKDEDFFMNQMKKYGIGLVVSTPYKNNSSEFVDIQIINWDKHCGTGNYLSFPYKK